MTFHTTPMTTVRNVAAVLLVSAVALVGACSTTNDRAVNRPIQQSSYGTPVNGQMGRVTDIAVLGASERSSAAGAVIGALAGAAIGSQIGGGDGRTAATAAGAIGGAVIGNQIAKRRADDVYRVTVRFDNGLTQQFDYERIDTLRVGDRVMYENGNLRIY